MSVCACARVYLFQGGTSRELLMDPLKEGESATSLPTWMFAGPQSSQPPECAGMDSG